jgi:hypothetical protein
LTSQPAEVAQNWDVAIEEFYKSAKEQVSMAHIFELEDEQGVVCSEQKTLEAICQNYYTKFYSANQPSPT